MNIMDPIALTAAKYQSFGWTVIQPAKGGINDLIAQKGSKMHFVQVVLKDSDLPRHIGEAKNAFIQNAFSNAAVPVFAHVSIGARGASAVTFEDVNLNTRVIVGARAAAKPKN